MLTQLKDYFHYTRTERNGLILLVMLLLLLVLIPRLYSWIKPVHHTDFSAFEKEIESFENNLQITNHQNKTQNNNTPLASPSIIDINTASKKEWLALGLKERQVNTIINYQSKGGRFFKIEDVKKIYGINEADYEQIKSYLSINKQVKIAQSSKPAILKNEPSKDRPIQLVFFNPNSATFDLLVQVGLSPKTANIMINYRDKGGTFRRKKDLLKIYGMTPEIYQRIEPYLVIEQVPTKMVIDTSQQVQEKPIVVEVEKEEKVPVIVDINQASSDEWKTISGIGPYYANQIVKFRDKLGGFSSIEQVGTTYGLADSTFQKIKTQLQLSPIFRKIDINNCSVKELQAHPYLKWKQANVIINYRKKHGPFQDIKDLHNILILNAEIIGKIAPYLSFE